MVSDDFLIVAGGYSIQAGSAVTSFEELEMG